MLLYFCTDYKEIDSTLLSWASPEGDGITCNDGSHVLFDGCTPLVLSTSQPIPEAMRSYSFDIQLVKRSSNINFSIGIKSDSSFVRYSTDNGDIQEDENVIHKAEAAEPNTIISFKNELVRDDS